MVKSPMSDTDVPLVAIHQVILQQMELHADKIALIDGITEKSYTYTEVLSIIRSVASGLTRLGLKKGDILAMFCPNCPEFVFMFYAALVCGGTVTLINPVYTVYEASKQLEDSKPRFLFASSDTAKTVMEAGRKAGLNMTCIASKPYPDCVSLDQLISDDGSRYPETVDLDVKEHVAIIPYSSGTTGVPKGVMLTHYNMVAMLAILRHPDLQRPGQPENVVQTKLAFLPFFHCYGLLAFVVGALATGDKVITLPRFYPERFLELIEKYKVTVLNLVPPVVVFLAKSPLVKKYDLSSVQQVGCGAAPLARETEELFVKMMGVPEIRQGFGMSETTIACTGNPGAMKIKPGSCGVPLSSCELQVVDSVTKKVLGSGQRGELWVKGPNVMKGYLNRPEATKEALDDQGWLHTGDIAYHDEEGYFYIVDRLKELIKYKGFQVAPAELEGLLLNHPKVDDVAVIGVPDLEAGELPKAYVVRKPGAQLTEGEVKQYVADHMSSFKHLRGGVEFMTAIPKSQSGKILRRELRDKLKQSRL